MVERTVAGRYRLVEPLVREGDWLAEDAELGRNVTLRLLGPDSEPFEAGARAAASLAHPHIGRLYDYGESDGVPFVVSEHLPGGSLETRLKTGGPLPAGEADRVARDVAAALAYAHEQGFAHGDLTSASVQFDAEGRAKITDFGTASGSPAGTAADVGAFGALAFRMLTGRDPDDPSSLARLRPDAPPALVATVLAALGGGVAARPAEGAGLVALLGAEPALVTAPSEPHTEVLTPVATARPRRRAPVLVGVAVGLLALLGAGVAVAFLAGGAGDGDGATPLPSVSVPSVSTISTATSAPVATVAPPPTTEATTSTAATTTRPETTTQAPPATTSAPPPTTEAPPAPPPTEEPTTEPPPEPTTTAETTTAIGTTTAP